MLDDVERVDSERGKWMIADVFIPVVNRLDLVEKAVRSAESDFTSVCIIDNTKDSVCFKRFCSKCRIFTPSVPLNFSQTQNLIATLSGRLTSSFYFFMHSDAEAHEGSVEKLFHLALKKSRSGEKWGAIFTNYDSLVAFNTKAMNDVGGWDTNLSWYASDVDMYRRLRLAGYSMEESGIPVDHNPSQTLKSDPKIAREVDLSIPFRDFYYSKKWGGLPGHETFKTPFNE